MKRLLVVGAKVKSTDELLRLLDANGFNIRDPRGIGYEWVGNDCWFSQPPANAGVDTKKDSNSQ